MTAKPVVFLAFANDRERRARYLRNLPEEARRLRSMLEGAQRAGLCELLVRQNLTREELFAVFQSAEYRDRVAVFHYGGHANGYALDLEDTHGGAKAAHAAGLAELLGAQRGLRLVFLNGCATEGQAQGLLDAGVAAVLVTSQKIKDEVALDFSGHFYAGLGSGASLERAYAEAKSAVTTGCGGAEPGEAAPDLYRPDSQTPPERWPWRLHIREGAERVISWNLPQAAGDPLFGLPTIPPGDLPERPYRHLQSFGRAHAELFFGRGRDVRALYERATDPHAAPILLLYGRSGVGKSSLLEAGLIPRLEQSHAVIYLRREQDLGLWGTLLEALEVGEELPQAACSHWRQREHQTGQPLDLILDQVEEIFTRPGPNWPEELSDFLDSVKTLLGDRRTRPQGKLVLGFRKEWLSELQQGLSLRELPFGAIPVEPLDQGGLIEAIAGPTRSQRLQQHYGLGIEEGLPETISESLLADPEAPLAPTLQVLLAKLWAAAKERDPSKPHFDSALYQTLKRAGLLLGDYLDQQLTSIEEQHPQAVKSGLVLDLLAYHTTARGTAEAHPEEDLLREYAHQEQEIRDLIGACQAGYLLLPIEESGTRLSHDTLAPLIRERFEESDRPGQRARTTLEGRAPDWADGKDGAPLDPTDLEQVEAGLGGMRILSAVEQRLVDASRLERVRRARQRKLLKALGAIAVVAVTMAAGAAFWQWWEADQAREQAERQGRIALSRQATAQARLVAERYPERALLLAIEAVRRPLETDQLRVGWAETLLRERLSVTGGMPLRGHKGVVSTLAFDPQGRWLATGSWDGTARLWDLANPASEAVVLRGHEESVSTLAFDPRGRWLATGSWDGTARLWDLANPASEAVVLRGHEEHVHTLAFDPRGRWLATGSLDGTARLWDLANPASEAVVLRGHEEHVHTLAFDPRGRWLATGSWDGTARLWDLANPAGEAVVLRGHEGGISTLAFDPEGRWLATGSGVGTARLWDLANPAAEAVMLRGHKGVVYTLAFDPQGRWLATGGGDGTARLWDLDNPAAEAVVLRGHKGAIYTLAFDPQGRWLATGGGDGTARLWDLDNPAAEAVVLRGHEADVRTLAFDPQGRWLATGSLDGTARLWDLASRAAEAVVLRGHEGVAATLAFDPQGRWLATGSWDGTARLWDLANPASEAVVLRGHEERVETLAFDPQGRWLATGGWDRTARLWDLANPASEAVVLHGHEERVDTLAFDPQGRWLATGSGVGTARLWDLANPASEAVVLRGHEGGISTLAFDPEGRWLATGSGVGTARLWDPANPASEAVVLRGHEERVETLAFDPQGRWLATGSEDGTARLWDPANPAAEAVVLRGHEADVRTLAFDPQGRWLATGSLDGTARLWDLANPASEAVVLHGHEEYVNTLAFDPQGRWLATGSDDGTARLWDLANPAGEAVVLHGHEEYVNTLAFDPQGRWLATGSGDGTARLWDLANPAAEAVVLRGHEGVVDTLAFDPQGRWLATGSDDGTARLWDPRIERLLRKACLTAGRNLTQQEWDLYLSTAAYRATCPDYPAPDEGSSKKSVGELRFWKLAKRMI